jgi:hypothetical protein
MNIDFFPAGIDIFIWLQPKFMGTKKGKKKEE